VVVTLLAAIVVPPAPAAARAEPGPPASDGQLVSSYPVRSAAVHSTAAPPQSIDTDRRDRPVAPGVTLSSFDRVDPRGWLRADAVTADLTGGVRVDYLYPGAVSAVEPLSAQADRGRAVAAVNGDFFDIDNSGAPKGVGISGGQVIKSPDAGWNRAVGIDAAGVGHVVDVFFEGSVTTPGGTLALAQLNNAAIPVDGIGAFTHLWGAYSRGRAVQGSAAVREVAVVGGRVAAVADTAGAGVIGADGFVLVGREKGADALRALTVGDAVSIDYRARSGDDSRLRAAIGGNARLLVDGAVSPEAADDVTAHPRTAVGFSADGHRMYLLTVDGRQTDSRGVTMRELALLMKELGAVHALNLDGGGSSTMLAREPGSATVQVENSPSDGRERPVPNGLGIFAPAGSGRLTGFWVETGAEPGSAPGAAPVRGGRPDRVFPGLTRTVTARGHDETYGPAAGDPTWRVDAPARGFVQPDGGQAATFRALLPGPVTVTAGRGGATGSLGLTVLGPLQRIEATTDRLTVADPQQPGRFGVVGYDRAANTAPIEPGDLRLDYDRSLLDITPAADGGFSVSAKQPTGSALVTVRVGNLSTIVPVSIGLEPRVFATFDDGAAWTFGTARAAGTVTPVAEGRTGAGLKLTYDFTLSTGTRTAYAIPPRPIAIEGQALALGAWVYGHGRGEWTAFSITDANNQTYSLYGPYITWTGWRYLEVAVPPTVAYPVTVNRFYTIETTAARQYTGEVIIDDLVAKVAPSVTVPVRASPRAPFVVTDATAGDAPWRYAVMSDAQFVAAAPNSPLVAAARRTLREIKAARPDFLVINGDLVDTAYPADFALARRVLTEELGDDLPWYYVPGNHEIMGPGDTGNFSAEFGTTYRSFDHRGVRFVLLNSATGTLRGGGFDQLALLRERLDEARGNPAVSAVVVMQHHPPRDPTPAKGSQLGDRKEAALVEQWLAAFQRGTGKGAAFVGAHVGAFHAAQVDGVPYLINGNSGKAPSTPAAEGGFTGWTMIGVDPRQVPGGGPAWWDPAGARPQWFRAEIRPHVDSLALAAPAQAVAGTPVVLRATISQGTRQVPAAYPVGYDWSASPGVHIGGWTGVRPWHVARLDPDTGELTGLRPGTVTVRIAVNGAEATATVVLVAASAAGAVAGRYAA
jgi:hypothetical protein